MPHEKTDLADARFLVSVAAQLAAYPPLSYLPCAALTYYDFRGVPAYNGGFEV